MSYEATTLSVILVLSVLSAIINAMFTIKGFRDWIFDKTSENVVQNGKDIAELRRAIVEIQSILTRKDAEEHLRIDQTLSTAEHKWLRAVRKNVAKICKAMDLYASSE